MIVVLPFGWIVNQVLTTQPYFVCSWNRLKYFFCVRALQWDLVPCHAPNVCYSENYDGQGPLNWQTSLSKIPHRTALFPFPVDDARSYSIQFSQNLKYKLKNSAEHTYEFSDAICPSALVFSTERPIVRLPLALTYSVAWKISMHYLQSTHLEWNKLFKVWYSCNKFVLDIPL